VQLAERLADGLLDAADAFDGRLPDSADFPDRGFTGQCPI